MAGRHLVERFENRKVWFGSGKSFGTISTSDAADARHLAEKRLHDGCLSDTWFTGDRHDAAAASGACERASEQRELPLMAHHHPRLFVSWTTRRPRIMNATRATHCGGAIDAFDRRREPVADSCHGRDEALTFVAERLAQKRDVARQPRVFDDGVWPDGLQEVLFPYDLTMPLHEHQQDLQHLRGQRDDSAIAHQQGPVG